jgi:hypothetical protein
MLSQHCCYAAMKMNNCGKASLLSCNPSRGAKPGTYKADHDPVHFAAHVLAIIEVDTPAHNATSRQTCQTELSLTTDTLSRRD